MSTRFSRAIAPVTTAITSMHEQRYARMNIAAAAEPRLRPEIFKKLMFKHRFIKSFMDVRNFADLDAVPDQPLASRDQKLII